ncbi:MAG: hypothetical protein IJM30_12600 [Thermoguttaceae bacterium]|nr:hypothetical protein [Thermoguttaceae bacterium]
MAPLFLWYWGTEKGVIPDNKGLLLIYIGVVYYLIPWTLGQIMKWPAIDERTALAGVLTNRPKIVILRHVPGSSSSSGRHKFQR